MDKFHCFMKNRRKCSLKLGLVLLLEPVLVLLHMEQDKDNG